MSTAQLDIPAAIEDIIHFVREQQIIEETWSLSVSTLGIILEIQE